MSPRQRIAAFFLALLVFTLPAHGQVALPDVNDPTAGMGVNIHFTDPQPGELEMLSQAGFHWVRMDFVWQSCEGTKGKYDFAQYDRLLAALDKFHIHAVFILDYSNPLYCGNDSPRTADERAAYARWAVASVAHFQGRGVIWEIWNEPNFGLFWHPVPNPNEYSQLAVTAARAIKNAFPNEIVVGPANAGVNLTFVAASAQAGGLKYWSGVTIHPYRRTPPETYGAAYDQAREIIRKFAPAGKNIPVCCGESGYSTAWIDETTQGKYLARLLLFDLVSKVPLTVWYDWHDDGTDPKEQEHNFGIVHNAYTAGAPRVYQPKPAYLAAWTYSHELGGMRFKERLKTASPDDYVLVFVDPHDSANLRFVAWTVAAPHQMQIPVPDGDYAATSFDGQTSRDVAAIGKLLPLQIDGGPQYAQLVEVKDSKP